MLSERREQFNNLVKEFVQVNDSLSQYYPELTELKITIKVKVWNDVIVV